MIKEEIEYDELGNPVQVKTTEKIAREPAYIGGASGDPVQNLPPKQAAPVYTPEEAIEYGQELSAQPLPEQRTEFVTAPLNQAPIDVTGIAPTPKPAAPPPPPEPMAKPVTQKEPPKIPSYKGKTENIELAEKMLKDQIASEQATEVQPIEQVDPAKVADAETDIAKQEQEATKLVIPQKEGLSIGDRLFRAAMVFLGGVGLKPGQENQVFNYYTKQAEKMLEEETKRAVASQKMQMTPYQQKYIDYLNKKLILDNAVKVNEMNIKREGMTQKNKDDSLKIANLLMEIDKTFNQVRKDEIDNVAKRREETIQEGPKRGLIRIDQLDKFGEKARERSVDMPGRPNTVRLASTPKKAEEATKLIQGYNLSMDYFVKLAETRAKWVKDGTFINPVDSLRSVRDVYQLEAAAVGQQMVEAGVLNEGEKDFFLQAIPWDFITLKNDQFNAKLNAAIKATNQKFGAKIKPLVPDYDMREIRSQTNYRYGMFAEKKKKK
jgi:hypothetical protein